MSIPRAQSFLRQNGLVCSDSWGTGGVEGRCVEITNCWMGIEMFSRNFWKTFSLCQALCRCLPPLTHSFGVTNYWPLEQQVSFETSSLQFYTSNPSLQSWAVSSQPSSSCKLLRWKGNTLVHRTEHAMLGFRDFPYPAQLRPQMKLLFSW